MTRNSSAAPRSWLGFPRPTCTRMRAEASLRCHCRGDDRAGGGGVLAHCSTEDRAGARAVAPHRGRGSHGPMGGGETRLGPTRSGRPHDPFHARRLSAETLDSRTIAFVIPCDRRRASGSVTERKFRAARPTSRRTCALVTRRAPSGRSRSTEGSAHSVVAEATAGDPHPAADPVLGACLSRKAHICEQPALSRPYLCKPRHRRAARECPVGDYAGARAERR